MKESILDKIFGKKKKNLVCQKCGKEIITPAFILIKGEIIANAKTPNIFLCPEQKWNYCQGIIMHDTCWMDMLREYGTELYNLEEVRKKYNKNKNKEVK